LFLQKIYYPASCPLECGAQINDIYGAVVNHGENKWQLLNVTFLMPNGFGYPMLMKSISMSNFGRAFAFPR